MGWICGTSTLFWQRGDDYMGDPGQEEQGLNSVYATDSTINMIKEAVSDINQIIQNNEMK